MINANNIYKIPLFLYVVIFVVGCQSSPADYKSIARNLNTEMELAFKKGEMKKLSAIYSDDGYLLSPNRKATHGRVAIDAYWERWHTPLNWTLDVIAVSKNEQDIYNHDYWTEVGRKPKHWREEGIEIGEAEVFYQLGHSKIEYESDDSVHKTSDVDFIIVWKKDVGGNYKIWIDTYI